MREKGSRKGRGLIVLKLPVLLVVLLSCLARGLQASQARSEFHPIAMRLLLCGKIARVSSRKGQQCNFKSCMSAIPSHRRALCLQTSQPYY